MAPRNTATLAELIESTPVYRRKRTMGDRRLRIESIAYHRNGVASVGFHVVYFREGRDRFVATVFPGYGEVAVLALASVAQRDAEDRYRGDFFEYELRLAVEKYEAERARAMAS